MQLGSLARAMGALVVLLVAAAVAYVALVTALDAVGVSETTASPAAVGGVVSAALAAADVYTPLGKSRRTELLREKRPGELGVDFAFASAVGFALGYLGGALLLTADSTQLLETAVVAAAVLVGYGTFVGRNVEVYSPGLVDENGSEA